MQQPHSPALVALALFLSTCLRTPPRILVASTNGPPVPRGAHVFCLNTGRPARVDSLVHVSDIVTTGRLLRATQGVHGTQTASVNAYFMYKSDERVNPTLWGQTMLTVKNFYNVSSSMLLEEMAMLFLVREPSDDIALLCYTNRLAITTTTVGRGQGGVEGEGESDIVQELLSVMDTMEEVGIANTVDNLSVQVTDPCLTESNTCMQEKAFCSAMNTQPGEMVRCVCLTGYYGDGQTCTALPDPVDTLAKALPDPTDTHIRECDQCGHGALCNISDKGVSCSCAHIECLASMEPVCSLNGQTYCNHCAAELASCQLQEAVVILYEGECEEDAVKPCGGISSPLIRDSTSVSCGEDLPCPVRHFCHRTNYFSVCCPVEVLLPSQSPSLILTQPTTTSSFSSSITTDIHHTPSPHTDVEDSSGSGSKRDSSISSLPMAIGSGSGNSKNIDNDYIQTDGTEDLSEYIEY